MDHQIAVIGCGVIGQKRLSVMRELGLGTPKLIFDTNPTLARQISQTFDVPVAQSLDEIWNDKAIDVVVIATPNRFLAQYAALALLNKKHCLIEKPGAISPSEVHDLLAIQQGTKLRCKVGYNLRFHPAATQIKTYLEQDRSPIQWIRATYGHGGRPGYEKEWRFDSTLSGGGEVIDQGVHLLDLAQWYCPDDLKLNHASRLNAHYTAEVEDNGFAHLSTPTGTQIQLHCSVTQWKNIFRFEITTDDQLIEWSGLGTPNYGPETLTIYTRQRQGGAPEKTQVVLEDAATKSWQFEWKHFLDCVEDPSKELLSSTTDAASTLQLVTQINNAPLIRMSDKNAQ